MHIINYIIKFGFGFGSIACVFACMHPMGLLEAFKIRIDISDFEGKRFKGYSVGHFKIDYVAVKSDFFMDCIGRAFWKIHNCVSLDFEFLITEAICSFTAQEKSNSMAASVFVHLCTPAGSDNARKGDLIDYKIMLHEVFHIITVIIIHFTFEIVNNLFFVYGINDRFVIV